MPPQNGLSTSAVESVAGLTAGIVSTLTVHPLDIIKTRLQVDATTNNQRFGSSITILRSILRENASPIKALYRGLTPNIIGNSLGWSLYFLWYAQAQNAMRIYRRYPEDTQLSSTDFLITSAAAGFATSLLTNPVWVIKTRMLSAPASQVGAYPSMTYGLKAIYREDGWRGYFRGLIPSLAGVTHGAIFFMAYEKLKADRTQMKSGEKLGNMENLVASGLAKIFAGVITYPHQTIRSRMQNYNSAASTSANLGVVGTIKQIWWREGWLGFYKGLGPNLVRMLPNTCVTMLVYENMKWALPRIGARETAASVS